jgi:hypothetical protein
MTVLLLAGYVQSLMIFIIHFNCKWVAVVLQWDTTHKQHTSHKITQRSNENSTQNYTHNKHPEWKYNNQNYNYIK